MEQEIKNIKIEIDSLIERVTKLDKATFIIDLAKVPKNIELDEYLALHVEYLKTININSKEVTKAISCLELTKMCLDLKLKNDN